MFGYFTSGYNRGMFTPAYTTMFLDLALLCTRFQCDIKKDWTECQTNWNWNFFFPWSKGKLSVWPSAHKDVPDQFCSSFFGTKEAFSSMPEQALNSHQNSNVDIF